MMAHIIIRTAESCPNCGALDPFRKGRKGRSVAVNGGMRRIYGSCRKCGLPMVVQYVRPKELEKTL